MILLVLSERPREDVLYGLLKGREALAPLQPLLRVLPLLAQAGYSSWLLTLTLKKGTQGGLKHGSAFESRNPPLWASGAPQWQQGQLH